MAINKDEAIEKARRDMARRLSLSADEIKESSVAEVDFPDMALGAPREDEMSGQMLTRGWRIRLQGGGRTLEYRADKNQVRLYDFEGENFLL